jgi:hypothetical protein
MCSRLCCYEPRSTEILWDGKKPPWRFQFTRLAEFLKHLRGVPMGSIIELIEVLAKLKRPVLKLILVSTSLGV